MIQDKDIFKNDNFTCSKIVEIFALEGIQVDMKPNPIKFTGETKDTSGNLCDICGEITVSGGKIQVTRNFMSDNHRYSTDKETLNYTVYNETLEDYDIKPVAEQIEDIIYDAIVYKGNINNFFGESANNVSKCAWCGEEFSNSDLKKEKDIGNICYGCIRAIESRGEKLDFN